MRYLRQSVSAQITLTFRDAAGALIDPIGNAANVTVYDGAGAQHVAQTAATRLSQGVYGLTLTGAQTAVLDRYRAVWTATVSSQAGTWTTWHEVIGGYLFELNDLRTRYPDDLPEASYSNDRVIEVRDQVEERFLAASSVAFQPRGRRARRDGVDGDTLIVPDYLPIRVISCTLDGVALTQTELDALVPHEAGYFTRVDGSWNADPGGIRIHYEHGLIEPPGPIRDAALRYARHLLVRKPRSDKATSQTTDVSTMTFATQRSTGPTGLPDVDAVLAEFGQTPIAIG